MNASQSYRPQAQGNGAFLILNGGNPRLSLRPAEPSPCTGACPAGVNVKGYVGLIAARKFGEALELIKEANPLPGICGRVCHHPCEAFCRRGDHDEPVAICWLKRFVADAERNRIKGDVQPIQPSRSERIAVVGSGPAGLTVANDLVRLGYGVTVFEASDEPGGMLVQCIPSFRLPRDIIRQEIQDIVDLGVELRTGVRVGTDVTVGELMGEEGFDAVFLGVGAQRPQGMGIPGEEGEGVFDCLTFLRQANSEDWSPGARRVAVVGGGHSAMDTARTAARLGAEEVTVVYRRSEQEMPADAADVEETETEGVGFTYLASPARVMRQEGRVVGLECVKNELGSPDASGRRRPVPVDGSEFVLEVDLVISAIGQKPDLAGLSDDGGIRVSERDTVEVDDTTLATAVPGVFAGGDAATGPRMVIDAIGHGHRASRAIHRYLLKGAGESDIPVEPADISRRELEIPVEEVEPLARRAMPRLPQEERRTFQEVDLGFNEEEAVREALRCLRCGPCAECPLCVSTCSKQHVVLSGSEHDILVRLPRDLSDSLLGPDGTPGLLSISDGPDEATVDIRPSVCRVQETHCRWCGKCADVCEYDAISIEDCGDGIQTARIDPAACKGCGVCISACPPSAIVPEHLTDPWIESLMADGKAASKVVVFTCNWNRASSCELLDPNERQDILPIEGVCSGRVHASLILKAFEHGAEGVVVVRCPGNQCHYGSGGQVGDGNIATARRLAGILGFGADSIQEVCVDATCADEFAETFEAKLAEARGSVHANH